LKNGCKTTTRTQRRDNAVGAAGVSEAPDEVDPSSGVFFFNIDLYSIIVNRKFSLGVSSLFASFKKKKKKDKVDM
jgi:hypothetical protein